MSVGGEGGGGVTVNVHVLSWCRTCRAVPCVRYEAATDGRKIRSALQSNAQRPYAKAKLLSVCLRVCLRVCLSPLHGSDAGRSPQRSSSSVPCWKVDQFGSHIGTLEAVFV